MEAIDNIMENINQTVSDLDLNGASETTLNLTETNYKAAAYENILFIEENKTFLDLGYFPELQEIGLERIIVKMIKDHE